MSRRLAIPFPRRQPSGAVRSIALTARATLFFASIAALSGCPHENREVPATPTWPDAHVERGTRATPPHAFPDVMMLGNPHLPAQLGFPQMGAHAEPTPVDAGSTAPESAGFLGGNDAALLRRVCDANIERIERNRGGSTISFRVWFEGGTRALFKPQQRADVANFRAELAAYRLSVLLGLHRVPPACGRHLERARLQAVADGSGDPAFSERVLHELLGREESVPGAMLYWVPGPLEPVPGAERWTELLDLARPLAPGDAELAADLSRLVLFDFVTDNVDRWSGGNILRQHLGGQAPGAMLFMDNGASFSVGVENMGARPHDQADRLAHVQRFPRALVTALRSLTADTIRASMHEDPLGALLGEAQITALLARRDAVVHHVDEIVAAHGEAAALVFP